MKRTFSTAGRLVSAAAVAAVLAGCSVLGGTAPVDTYDLTVPATSPVRGGRATQVLVPEPIVDRVYDGDRIVVRPKATEVATLTGAQWSDRLPRLLQSRLIEALERSGRVHAAGRPGQGLAIDRQLVVDVRAFDHRPAEGRAVVDLAVRLMDDRSGRIVAARAFRAEQPVASDAPAAVATALDAAFGQVLGDLVVWVGR